MSKQQYGRFVLASASPRRKQLLTEAGYDFLIVQPDINESAFLNESISPCEYAKALALAKAKNVAPRYPELVVMGADTIVDFNGHIIGKACDATEAERITRKLFSSPHKVITALAIIRLADRTEIVETDTTVVYPKKMTDEQIAEHIKSGSWQDKAGAYAIQESGDRFVERIDGSLTNVMGLPMELLQRLLSKVK